MTDIDERKAIETLRYRLQTIEAERKRATAADTFRAKLTQARVSITGRRFRAFRWVLGEDIVDKTFELTDEETKLLDDWLRDQAYKRRFHADALEKQAANGGAR